MTTWVLGYSFVLGVHRLIKKSRFRARIFGGDGGGPKSRNPRFLGGLAPLTVAKFGDIQGASGQGGGRSEVKEEVNAHRPRARARQDR